MSGESQQGAGAGTATLAMAFSADHPLELGSRHLLDVDEVLIGRGASRACSQNASENRSTLMLRFPDARMSSAHARLVRQDETWSLQDQHSKNKSRVNSEQVEGTLLDEGDMIEL